jgi:Neprosin
MQNNIMRARRIYILGALGLALAAMPTFMLAAPATSHAATPQPARPHARLVTSQYAPKGKPPPFRADAAGGATVTPFVLPRPGSGVYLYATAIARTLAVADGARGYFTIAKPVVAAGGHSLAEIAVESPDEHQVVEIGWTVDRGLNGDDDPHLFVYHWINGQGTCYNGCGYVPISVPGLPTYAAGMKLPVSSTPVEFAIYHHGTGWLVGYNNHWIGSFPDSEWTNPTFKVTGKVQWFGEVNTPTANPTPCTQMGNGEPASSATAARVEKIGFWGGGGPVGDFETNPDLYSGDVLYSPGPGGIGFGPSGFRFGGPGACSTVPDIIGDSRTVATSEITAAGLVRGNATPVTDWLCEDLNNVLSQTPVPGTQLSRGLAVSYTYGVPPATGGPKPRP